MKPVTGIVSAVGELVDRLTLPAREKKQLETDLLRVFMEWEQRVMEARSAVLVDCRVGGRSSWQLVTTLVATVGNVDICLDCSCRYFHESADSLRYFPLLGFTGNRNRRIRGGKERGENHAGFHAQAALIQ